MTAIVPVNLMYALSQVCPLLGFAGPFPSNTSVPWTVYPDSNEDNWRLDFALTATTDQQNDAIAALLTYTENAVVTYSDKYQILRALDDPTINLRAAWLAKIPLLSSSLQDYWFGKASIPSNSPKLARICTAVGVNLAMLENLILTVYAGP